MERKLKLIVQDKNDVYRKCGLAKVIFSKIKNHSREDFFKMPILHKVYLVYLIVQINFKITLAKLYFLNVLQCRS